MANGDLSTLKKIKRHRKEVMAEFTNNLQQDLIEMMKERAEPNSPVKEIKQDKKALNAQLEELISAFSQVKNPFEAYFKSKSIIEEQSLKISNKQLREFIKTNFNKSTLDKLVTFEQFTFDSLDRENPLIKNFLKEMRDCHKNERVKGSRLTVTELWSKEQLIESSKALNFEKDRQKLLRYSSLSAAKIKETKKKEEKLGRKAVAMVQKSEANAIISAQIPKGVLKDKEIEQEEARQRLQKKLSNNVDLNAELVKNIKGGIETGLFDRRKIFKGSQRNMISKESDTSKISEFKLSGLLWERSNTEKEELLDLFLKTPKSNFAPKKAFKTKRKNTQPSVIPQDSLPLSCGASNEEFDYREFLPTSNIMTGTEVGTALNAAEGEGNTKLNNRLAYETSIDKSPLDLKSNRSRMVCEGSMKSIKPKIKINLIEKQSVNTYNTGPYANLPHERGLKDKQIIQESQFSESKSNFNLKPFVDSYLPSKGFSQTSLRKFKNEAKVAILKRQPTTVISYQKSPSRDIRKIQELMDQADTLQKTNQKDIR